METLSKKGHSSAVLLQPSGRRISPLKDQGGITLIELVVVLLLIGVGFGVVAVRTGSYSYWREEGFIRRLSETIVFMHYQAVTDQAFYQLEFDFDTHTYSVGVIRPDADISEELKLLASDAGHLTLELATFLSPAIGRSHTVIPPPSFPSLAEPIEIPPEIVFTDIRTMRGKKVAAEGGKAYILFSPRGFSEFSVLHFETSNGGPVTILVNPFTGNTTIYREYRDFQWTYGKDKDGRR
ncbi:MAG: prepilin-type N-terminal cleavage/methylation domain-containing protein [Deltaproteobacteria bacterium]|nr:prepilin-type N-terminal cleavage/methylation domain-containing protein [Deltaproteobacteria bacterium]